MTKKLQTEIIEKIKGYDKIIIHRHVNPDPDALGSQFGFKKLLEENFGKTVYAVGEIPESLSFMGTADTIEDSIYENALCFVLDTANEQRVADQRFSKSPCVIKIDHHPDREPFGDISWVDTSFSSTCEMIVDLLFEIDNFATSTEAAKLLYTGIVGDTGRFLYSNTNARTLRYAAFLKEFGFESKSIYDSFYTISKKIVAAKVHLLSTMKITENGVAYSVFTENDLKNLAISANEAADLVNEMSYIEGVHIWALFVEAGEQKRVRVRSSERRIDLIANKYGGGGHQLASGINIEDKDFKPLLRDLDFLLK